MSDPISSIRILPAEVDSASLPSVRTGRSGFAATLESAIDNVDQLQGEAHEQVEALLNGSGADVHSTMIAVEKADLAFELMMQVRNKIVAAYQEISRMQF
jgi:flagellar hook-basal body complex protein FliE